ncbi:MAG TPA: polyprenyl synthetase family protein [Thermoanaerobaculia bacterium]|jgi:octaprenyl-diphosphate synthase|nr:polyprenyl synthetase family protein [Thermoanaerobaculia bacterium]
MIFPPRAGNARLLRAYDLISDKLSLVEEELLLHFRSPIPTIDRIGGHLAQGGGKRIRPALLLLCSRLLEYDEKGRRDVRYATVIEFIHTATLVHDDVIDEARLRRGRTSANARWGNNLTVLFGDYLYTKSMGIALDEGDLTILKVLSDTTLSMIEGEIIGTEKTGSLQITREEALDIIRRKTADLFSAACRLPAHFAPRGDLVAAERLAEYGRCLGVAFQLIDDLLDYTGSVEATGKPVLNDLREGKLTMPLLLSLPRATPAERERVALVMREREFDSVAPVEILEIAERHGGLAETRSLARDYAGAARVALGSFPESEAKDGLLLATESVIDRVG